VLQSWLHLQWSNRFQDSLELYEYRYSELQYHCDWNWLINVVEKIESLGYKTIIQYSFEIGIHECKIYTNLKHEHAIYAFHTNNKINAVWNCVKCFILWYNQDKDESK